MSQLLSIAGALSSIVALIIPFAFPGLDPTKFVVGTGTVFGLALTFFVVDTAKANRKWRSLKGQIFSYIELEGVQTHLALRQKFPDVQELDLKKALGELELEKRIVFYSQMVPVPCGKYLPITLIDLIGRRSFKS